MDFLAPLGPLEIIRAAFFAVLTLFIPGFLLLKLEEKKSISKRLFSNTATQFSALFAGPLEMFAASVFFSIIISALAYVALTFSVRLTFLSGLLAMATIISVEAYFLWIRK